MTTSVTQYDPGLIPSEVAARKEREGELFGKTAKTNKQDSRKGVNATGGYTLDQEGLTNNYAIEPEMYVNRPGDLRQANVVLTAERANELAALAEDETGRLTMAEDTRHKGQGRI